MPFTTYNVGTVNTRVTAGEDLAPGMLIRAEVQFELVSIGPCDVWGALYVKPASNMLQYSEITLDYGLICVLAPLVWIGELPILTASTLVSYIVGNVSGSYRVSWTRRPFTPAERELWNVG